VIGTLPPFFRFAITGAAGFFVDIAVLWAAMHWGGLSPYAGRAVSYLAAATFTWAVNRHLTFGERRARDGIGMAREWLAFLTVNLGGMSVNYALFAVLVAWGPAPLSNPFIAAGGGSIAGLFVNYAASSRFVFRR
jgi:putative flippase GtrA